MNIPIYSGVFTFLTKLLSIDSAILTWYPIKRYPIGRKQLIRQENIHVSKLRIKQVAARKGVKQSHLQIIAAVTPHC